MEGRRQFARTVVEKAYALMVGESKGANYVEEALFASMVGKRIGANSVVGSLSVNTINEENIVRSVDLLFANMVG